MSIENLQLMEKSLLDIARDVEAEIETLDSKVESCDC